MNRNGKEGRQPLKGKYTTIHEPAEVIFYIRNIV